MVHLRRRLVMSSRFSIQAFRSGTFSNVGNGQRLARPAIRAHSWLPTMARAMWSSLTLRCPAITTPTASLTPATTCSGARRRPATAEPAATTRGARTSAGRISPARAAAPDRWLASGGAGAFGRGAARAVCRPNSAPPRSPSRLAVRSLATAKEEAGQRRRCR